MRYPNGTQYYFFITESERVNNEKEIGCYHMDFYKCDPCG